LSAQLTECNKLAVPPPIPPPRRNAPVAPPQRAAAAKKKKAVVRQAGIDPATSGSLCLPVS
jgi:hypothetical protein